MSQPSGLRKRIEKVGQDVLNKYCQKTSGPIMIPPIPDSKFIDKLPGGVTLQGQDGYETEVKVFRYLEDVGRNVIILHQLEYTHEQYSAFLPNHQCNKKNCSKQPKIHQCHQHKTNVEGETDFLVLGDNFALVLEVKGALTAVEIQGGCEDGLRQRQRIVNLINSVNSDLPVFDFTVFSNVSGDEVDETYLYDKSLIFSEHLKFLDQIIEYASIVSGSAGSQTTIVKRCLLGLWCMNNDNKWDLRDCSLSKCIADVNGKLRRCLVTERSVDDAKQSGTSSKNKTRKLKKYPDNPDIVEAPDIFKEYLEIRCLTKAQVELFESEERFLWVEGPAGSGKTVAMLGKVIDIALKTPPNERIIIILPGMADSPAPKRHLEKLNNIGEDVTCIEIVYNYRGQEGDISEQLDKAHSSSSQKLTDSTDKIVLLRIEDCLINSIHGVITECFNYIFVDDYQTLHNYAWYDMNRESSCADRNVLSEVLLSVVQNSSTNNTSMWILCDDAQSWSKMWDKDSNDEVLESLLDELRNHRDVKSKELTVNLRNAFEISAVLSITRKHFETMDFDGTLPPVTWPQQEDGHFLRANKPVIYLLQSSDTVTETLVQELEILRGSDSCLVNKDIAVIHSIGDSYHFVKTRATVNKVLERWNTTDDEITLLGTMNCASAEYAAVIVICSYWSGSWTVQLPDNREEEITCSDLIPQLYMSLSRARVYGTVIVFNYTPNICKYSDKLLDELRLRNDVCKVIDR